MPRVEKPVGFIKFLYSNRGVYQGPPQTSKMNSFAKLVNGWWCAFKFLGVIFKEVVVLMEKVFFDAKEFYV